MDLKEMFQQCQEKNKDIVTDKDIDNMFMSPKEVEFNNLRTRLVLNGILKDRQKPKQNNNKRKKKKKRK